MSLKFNVADSGGRRTADSKGRKLCLLTRWLGNCSQKVIPGTNLMDMLHDPDPDD